jgi:hypothetical protein
MTEFSYNYHNSGRYPSSCLLFKSQLNSTGLFVPHVLYAVRDMGKENRRFVLLRTSCILKEFTSTYMFRQESTIFMEFLINYLQSVLVHSANYVKRIH